MKPDSSAPCPQELQRRLSEEIGQLRAFITAQGSRDGASHNNERNSCELEVRTLVSFYNLVQCPLCAECLRYEMLLISESLPLSKCQEKSNQYGKE